MSLVSTLAKVAVGVVIAKGMGSLIQSAQAGSAAERTRRNPGSADTFGGTHSADRGARLPGGLENVMKDALAGTPAGRSAGSGHAPGGSLSEKSMQGGTAGGGLGDLLEGLTKGSTPAGRSGTAGGGLDDIIGQLSQGGGLGNLIGGLAGALGGAAATRGAGGGFGDLLNQALRNGGEPDAPPSQDQEAVAGLMLRAMIQAAKSDGRIDESEKQKIVEKLGDASPSDVAFLKRELAAPVDVAGLARQVPGALAPQVYAVSVMAIALDEQSEAQYLHQLAQGLGLDPQSVNAIHARLGVQPLYG